MSNPKESISPFLEAQDALLVASVINRFAASFDVKKELALAEARVLFVLLARVMGALLEAFPDELQELLTLATRISDDEPEPNDSN